ncbi:hypothetical protein [Aquimarina longa]|uniref:hypothetical protein n=1 Tax=Aquimarina longa TaxID=1080221 RepID=UPI003B845981
MLKKVVPIFSKSDEKSINSWFHINNMYSIEKICKVLKVSRSSYYRWYSNGSCNRVLEDQKLTLQVQKDCLNFFRQSPYFYNYSLLFYF